VAHPLALEFAQRIAAERSGARVLLLGAGSGRNVAPLRAAALDVTIVEDDARRARDAGERFAADPRVAVIHAAYAEPAAPGGAFSGVLSTHALLHGCAADIVGAIRAIRERLVPGGLFFTTLGSVADPRYGAGRRIAARTFAPRSGPEAGVPHTFFHDAGVRTLLGGFVIESLAETSAAESAGRWAHSAHEAASIVHWFVRASSPA